MSGADSVSLKRPSTKALSASSSRCAPTGDTCASDARRRRCSCTMRRRRSLSLLLFGRGICRCLLLPGGRLSRPSFALTFSVNVHQVATYIFRREVFGRHLDAQLNLHLAQLALLLQL